MRVRIVFPNQTGELTLLRASHTLRNIFFSCNVAHGMSVLKAHKYKYMYIYMCVCKHSYEVIYEHILTIKS